MKHPNIIYPPLVEQSFAEMRRLGIKAGKDEVYAKMVEENLINTNGNPTEWAIEQGYIDVGAPGQDTEGDNDFDSMRHLVRGVIADFNAGKATNGDIDAVLHIALDSIDHWEQCSHYLNTVTVRLEELDGDHNE